MEQKSNVEVRCAQIPDDIESIKKLWFDYLVWGNDKMQELYSATERKNFRNAARILQNR